MTRGLVALAMLVALLGAPRPVSAAANDFATAQVSPPSGTVTTIFVMRVGYEGAFPATRVTVTVAGTTRPMALEQGTLSAGTWLLATTLPAGTWTPTFAASVLRGPSPTRAGPTVSVAELAVATPTEPPDSDSATPRSSGPIDQAGDEPESVDEPNVAPAATSDVAPADEPDSEAQASPHSAGPAGPGSAPAPGTRPPGDSDPGGGTTVNGAAASPTDHPKPARAETPGAGSTPPDRDGEGAARAADDGAAPGRDRAGAPVRQDDLLGVVLIIGLIGVAAVALAGTLLLAASRRRHDPEEPAAVVVGAAPDATATDDLLTRRTLQRARMRLADDPIVSALGVDEQMRARRDRRARLAATDDRPPGDA